MFFKKEQFFSWKAAEWMKLSFLNVKSTDAKKSFPRFRLKNFNLQRHCAFQYDALLSAMSLLLLLWSLDHKRHSAFVAFATILQRLFSLSSAVGSSLGNHMSLSVMASLSNLKRKWQDLKVKSSKLYWFIASSMTPQRYEHWDWHNNVHISKDCQIQGLSQDLSCLSFEQAVSWKPPF